MRLYLMGGHCAAAESTAAYLQEAGHQVQHFTQTSIALRAVSERRPSLVLLDWTQERMSGFPVLRRVRHLYGSTMPVIVLSSNDSPEVAVAALRAGADDYVAKPVSGAILLARIEALVRRMGFATPLPEGIQCGPYRFDYHQQSLSISGEFVALTPTEFDLAWALFSRAGQLASKVELVASVWGKNAEVSGHALSQHLHTLRKKLCLREHGFRLVSIYGNGYRLERPLGCVVTPAVQRPTGEHAWHAGEVAGASAP